MVSAPSTGRMADMVRCNVANESYGLEMSWVRGIHRVDRLKRDPQAGGGVVGVLPEREGDILVFSLARVLGRPAYGSGATQHIVVLHGDPALALLVDHVSPVLRVPSGCLLALPDLIEQSSVHFFRGVIALEGTHMLCLAPERLIPGTTLKRESHGQLVEFSLPARLALHPANPAEGRRRSLDQLVIFSTAEPTPAQRPLSFGLSMAQVLEILDPPALLPVPGAPESILGVVAWHGRPVPVIDLGRRMGLAPLLAEKRTRLLVARATSSAEPVGFLVRPSIRVVHLPIAHLPCKQPPPIDLALTRGAIELRNETLIIPNIGTVTSFCAA